MTYLDIARSALSHREQSEKSSSQRTSRQSEEKSGCEISEQSEKSQALHATRLPTPNQAEELKAQIIAAVTVEPEDFDRARYETLLARWNAHEAALVRQSAEEPKA